MGWWLPRPWSGSELLIELCFAPLVAGGLEHTAFRVPSDPSHSMTPWLLELPLRCTGTPAARRGPRCAAIWGGLGCSPPSPTQRRADGRLLAGGAQCQRELWERLSAFLSNQYLFTKSICLLLSLKALVVVVVFFSPFCSLCVFLAVQSVGCGCFLQPQTPSARGAELRAGFPTDPSPICSTAGQCSAPCSAGSTQPIAGPFFVCPRPNHARLN